MIVESPTKTRTLKKYLGPDFDVAATVGHIKDLPVRELGISVQEGFKAKYTTIQGKEKVVIDPDVATYYLSTRRFATEQGSYTNLIYRIHFQKIPFSIVPFHLGSGGNVGLLAVVTLNSRDEVVLYSLLHTCGCYLAFIPTSNLPEADLPIGWK